MRSCPLASCHLPPAGSRASPAGAEAAPAPGGPVGCRHEGGGGAAEEASSSASAVGPARSHRQVRFEVPAGATEIVLVRHGETIASDPDRPFPLLDGFGNPELRSEGLEQAEKVAERLAVSGRVDAIYVTPLRRTGETAAPLAARLQLEPIVEPRLREVNLGEWEGGLYRHKVITGDPMAIEMISKERWDVVPGAETNEELAAAGHRRHRARSPPGTPASGSWSSHTEAPSA